MNGLYNKQRQKESSYCHQENLTAQVSIDKLHNPQIRSGKFGKEKAKTRTTISKNKRKNTKRQKKKKTTYTHSHKYYIYVQIYKKTNTGCEFKITLRSFDEFACLCVIGFL